MPLSVAIVVRPSARLGLCPQPRRKEQSPRPKTSSGSGNTRPTPTTRTAGRTISSRTALRPLPAAVPHRAADLLGFSHQRPLSLARQHRARSPHRPRQGPRRRQPLRHHHRLHRPLLSRARPALGRPRRRTRPLCTTSSSSPPRLEQARPPTTDPAPNTRSGSSPTIRSPSEPRLRRQHVPARRAIQVHRPLGRAAARRLRHRPEHHPRHPRRPRRHATRSCPRQPSASHHRQLPNPTPATAAPTLKPRN